MYKNSDKRKPECAREPNKTIFGKGIPIKGQAQEIRVMCSVTEYLEEEKLKGEPISPFSKVLDGTSRAVGISKNTEVKIGIEKYFKEESQVLGSKLRPLEKKYVRGISPLQ